MANLKIDFFDGFKSETTPSSIIATQESGPIQAVTILDKKSSGVDGGDSSNTPIVRELNTLQGDTSFVSLSNNAFTLEPGTYKISWTAPAVAADRHRTALHDGTNYVAMGSSEFANSGVFSATTSHGSYVAEIASSTTYTVQHSVETPRQFNGHGVETASALPFTQDEVYAVVEIEKII